MKEIKAYIKPHMLSKVTRALQKVEGLTGMSVINIQGFGRGRAKGAPRGTDEDLLDYSLRMKIEIFCKDDYVDEIVSLIEKTYRPPGTGKSMCRWKWWSNQHGRPQKKPFKRGDLSEKKPFLLR
jgi:nitrogen regulatory protein PII